MHQVLFCITDSTWTGMHRISCTTENVFVCWKRKREKTPQNSIWISVFRCDFQSASLKQRPECVCVQATVHFPWTTLDRRSAFLPFLSGTCRWVTVYSLFRSAALKATFLTGLFHSLRIRACRSLTLWTRTNPFYNLRLNSSSSGACHHEIKAIAVHKHTHTNTQFACDPTLGICGQFQTLYKPVLMS